MFKSLQESDESSTDSDCPYVKSFTRRTSSVERTSRKSSLKKKAKVSRKRSNAGSQAEPPPLKTLKEKIRYSMDATFGTNALNEFNSAWSLLNKGIRERKKRLAQLEDVIRTVGNTLKNVEFDEKRPKTSNVGRVSLQRCTGTIKNGQLEERCPWIVCHTNILEHWANVHGTSLPKRWGWVNLTNEEHKELEQKWEDIEESMKTNE